MGQLQDVTVTRADARIEGTTLDGVLHGPTRVEADRVPLAQLHYAHGILHGPATMLYPDGSPSARLNYVEGKLDGRAVYYLEDGTVQREAHYAGGLLHGDCKTWLPDGTLIEHATYRQGKLQGLFQRFHPNRQLAERQYFDAGKPVESAERYATDGRPLDAEGKPMSRWQLWWCKVHGTPPPTPAR